MILSMTDQVKLFLLTVGMGFIIGFAYDFLRIFRRLIKHNSFMCNLEDGIYWLCVSAIMFNFMVNKNYGEIRLFSILGAFIGMILYFLTLSRPIIKLNLMLAEYLKKVFVAMFKIIILPFRLLIGLIKIPAFALLSIFNKFLPVGKKALQKPGRYAKMKGNKIKNDLKVIFKKV